MTNPSTPRSDSPRTVLDRRGLLGVAALGSLGAAGAAVAVARSVEQAGRALAWQDGDASPPPGNADAGTFLTTDELAFVAAAADRIIPPDPTGPGASEAGVPTFIDRQLAGPYGQGDHLYLGGPWPDGTPTQGFQSRLAPANYYRAAIADIDAVSRREHGGRGFAGLAAGDQDALLRRLEAGTLALPQVDAKTFFAMLLQNVQEGYFADPIYGGNRGMAGWSMIGFPGARYDYGEWVARHGAHIPYPPVGLTGRPGWEKP